MRCAPLLLILGLVACTATSRPVDYELVLAGDERLGPVAIAAAIDNAVDALVLPEGWRREDLRVAPEAVIRTREGWRVVVTLPAREDAIVAEVAHIACESLVWAACRQVRVGPLP